MEEKNRPYAFPSINSNLEKLKVWLVEKDMRGGDYWENLFLQSLFK